MIKKTLYFGNPVYLSLKNAQLVIKLPEIVKSESLPETFKQQSEVTKPIEDIGIVVLDHKQITITSGVLEALLENNCAVITCDSKSMPVGLMSVSDAACRTDYGAYGKTGTDSDAPGGERGQKRMLAYKRQLQF